MLAGMEGNKGNDVSESAYENFCRSTKNLDSLDKRSTDCDVDTKAQGYLPNHGDGEEREKGVWRRMFQSRWCKYADITITVLVIALLWIMMALPTVIYIDKSVRHV